MRGLASRWISRLDDPLLRFGTTLMFLALGCAVVVLAYAFTGGMPERADAAVRPLTRTSAKPPPKPLVRTDPGISPWVERDIPPPRPEATPEPQVAPPNHQSRPPEQAAAKAPPAPEPARKPVPQQKKPRPQEHASSGHRGTGETTREAKPRQAAGYKLPPGAIMTLTVPELGIKNAPVMNSASESALDRGVVHLPDTSLPWSDTPERNVYLAGHRLGWPGTGSHRIFYRLDELTGGEEVALRGPNGKTYNYRVLDNFVVGPRAQWVTGRIRDRDLLTLQTCTPIPTYQNRLIVRAERI
jgi:sortase A